MIHSMGVWSKTNLGVCLRPCGVCLLPVATGLVVFACCRWLRAWGVCLLRADQLRWETRVCFRLLSITFDTRGRSRL
jgi:hypothetical protein